MITIIIITVVINHKVKNIGKDTLQNLVHNYNQQKDFLSLDETTGAVVDFLD